MPKRPTFRLFQMHYNKQHTPGPFAQHVIEESRGIAIRPQVLHNYQTRDRTGLWISVMGNTAVVKRVVRSDVSRKVRQAFTAALAERGYAADGTSPEGNLKGSIVFANLQFIQVLQSPVELKGEMDRLVAWLDEGRKRVAGRRRDDEQSKGEHESVRNSGGEQPEVETMQAQETRLQDDEK